MPTINTILITAVALMSGVNSVASSDSAPLPEYIPGPIKCRLVEVSVEYDSGTSKSIFQCLVASHDPTSSDGRLYELKNLPPEFEQTYRGKFVSGEAILEVRNIYCSASKMIFTRDTTWSITTVDLD